MRSLAGRAIVGALAALTATGCGAGTSASSPGPGPGPDPANGAEPTNGAEPANEEEAPRSEAPEAELVFGESARESNSSVDETRIVPVRLRWRDADGVAQARTVMELRSGEGEGAGDFARLEDLDWAEAAARLRAARPPATTHTLYFNQGRWGWLGVHLVSDGERLRVVAQRYEELTLRGATEATLSLEGPSEPLAPPPPIARSGRGVSGGGGGGADCEQVQCFRAIECVARCGGPVLQSGCCPCPDGQVDSLTCRDEASE